MFSYILPISLSVPLAIRIIVSSWPHFPHPPEERGTPVVGKGNWKYKDGTAPNAIMFCEVPRKSASLVKATDGQPFKCHNYEGCCHLEKNCHVACYKLTVICWKHKHCSCVLRSCFLFQNTLCIISDQRPSTLTDALCGCHQSLHANFVMFPRIGPQPRSFIPFPINYSLIILSFEAMQYKLLVK